MVKQLLIANYVHASKTLVSDGPLLALAGKEVEPLLLSFGFRESFLFNQPTQTCSIPPLSLLSAFSKAIININQIYEMSASVLICINVLFYTCI